MGIQTGRDLTAEQALKKNLMRLHEEWISEYADIPWLTQSLRIPVETTCTSVQFHCIFTNIARVPLVELELRDGLHSTDSQVLQWDVPENAPGLLLSLKGIDSRSVTALHFRQNPELIQRSGMVCLQRDLETGEWIVIYNSLERVKALSGKFQSRLKKHPGQLAKGIYQCIDSLLHDDVKVAVEHLAKVQISPALKPSICALMDRFQLQPNAHGMKRVFRFWTVEEKRCYMQKALDIIQVLRGLTEQVCISGGAVLGYRREGKLLDHDDDLDIVVGVRPDEYGGIGPTLDVLARCLIEAGYRVKGYFFAHLWIETDAQTGQTLDVFVAILEDQEASFYPSKRKAMKSDCLFPAALHKLEGMTLPMPANIDGYLDGVYGSSWQQPDPGFAHPWDRSEYAGLSGPRKHEPMWTRGELERRSHVLKRHRVVSD